MGGRVVQIEVGFLHVLAVVAFRPAQAKQSLLQDGVALVPQGQGQTEVLVIVANPGQPIFVPAVDAAASVVVGEIAPGLSVVAVILAHRAPGAFAEIRPPALPGDRAAVRLGQAAMFGGVAG